MIFTLDIAALPAGYGEAVLPLDLAKAHLRVLHDDEDDLIAALRDAAIVMVEEYTGLVLNPRAGIDAIVWRAEELPSGSGAALMGRRPITAIEEATYLDAAGAAQPIDVTTLRVVEQDRIAPKPGAAWPAGVGGGVVISFAAGVTVPPPPLVLAANMFVATLYVNRETIVQEGVQGTVPAGVAALCRPYRRPRV